MTHPFPAEHDQQQAEAIDVLKEAKAFLLVHFSPGEECDSPFCGGAHTHRETKVIASCTSMDLHHAMTAIAEEIQITESINTLMGLNQSQREQIAELLQAGADAFIRLRDDDED
jgi:hypothetical protein